MNAYAKRVTGICIKWAVVLSLLSFLLLRDSSWGMRIVNSIFLGGLILTAFGGLGFASWLGGFDLFEYAHKKLSRYSKKNIEEGIKDDVGSYYDFISQKQRKSTFLIPLGVGFGFVLISILLIFLL
jgi:hypothetical protein